VSAETLAVARTGLVTSVGLSAPAACAAIRCGLTNPTETRFVDSKGKWIMSHAVELDEPLRGLPKLAHMAAMTIDECLIDVPRAQWAQIPILLCVAEQIRPGRIEGLEDELLPEICKLLENARFSDASIVIPHGRVSVGVALLQARKLLNHREIPAVLIVATDSLLRWPTLKALDQQARLLTESNSNGFIPGEAASAILVTRPSRENQMRITGLGFATEQASIETDEPLRADGLSRAIGAALNDAGCEPHDVDFRITDIAGEHYYFKEAALALSRTLRRRKEEFDLWHPAECIGEVGSAIGPAMIAVAEAATRKAYAPGPTVLLHAANDAGQRAAIIMRFTVS
jgi:3-oxoacyl-[acyl-carrier-protein] synthase-1